MLDEREALVAAIAANPAEDTPRLVFADWLQEHDEEDRAEFIRLQCQARQFVLAGAKRWPNPDPQFEEVWERARGLFDLRQQFWIEPFCRALGAEEIPPAEPPRGLVARVIRRFRSEPRSTLYFTDYFGGDSATLKAGGNGPVSEIGFDRGFVNLLDVSCHSPHPLRDITAAFKLEPVTDLRLVAGANFAQWRALDTPGLRQVRYVNIQMPGSDDRSAAGMLEAIGDCAYWSELRDLSVWSPGFPRPSTGYLGQLTQWPLLSRLTMLRIHPNLSELRLLARSRTAAGLRGLSAWGAELPDEAGSVLVDAVFEECLEELGLSLNHLGDEGVRGLVSGGWPRLRSLDLGCNGIGDEGVRHLLPLVPQLRELSLATGNITDAGALALAEVVDSEKLVYFCLSYNPLSEETVRSLRDRFGERFQFTTREEDEQRHRGVP